MFLAGLISKAAAARFRFSLAEYHARDGRKIAGNAMTIGSMTKLKIISFGRARCVRDMSSSGFRGYTGPV